MTLGKSVFIMSNFFSQIKIEKLFQVKYIFESTPSANGLYVYLLIVFAIFILLAVVLTIFYKKPRYLIYKRLKNYLFNFFLTCGLIGLGLMFFRFQQIPYFGSRLMFLLLFLTFIIWGGWILYFRLFIVLKVIKKEQEKENFSKYLPNKAMKG